MIPRFERRICNVERGRRFSLGLRHLFPLSFGFYFLKLAAVAARQATQHVDFLRLLLAVEVVDDVQMRSFGERFLLLLC